MTLKHLDATAVDWDAIGAAVRRLVAYIVFVLQNMLLACRALGLGSTLTTRHMMFGKEVDAELGLPKGVQSYAILPIGWPMGKFGPLGRGRRSDVVFLDTYGSNWREADPA